MTDDGFRFSECAIDQVISAGRGLEPAHALSRIPDGYLVTTGVEMPMPGHRRDAVAAVVTIAVSDRLSHVLDVSSARTGDRLAALVEDIAARYQSAVYVAGDVEIAHLSALMRPNTSVRVSRIAGAQTTAYSLESMAIEIGAGRWAVPNSGGARSLAAEFQALLQEMVSHTVDSDRPRLLALWVARTADRQRRLRVAMR